MPTSPSIFIGSSSEALPLAKAIGRELETDFRPQLWDDRLFQLGEDTLSGLLRAVLAFDYAILVISDDDTLNTSRGSSREVPTRLQRMWQIVFPPSHQYAVARDNVIFELGLFMGAMGRRRAFVVVAPSKRGAPKIPSDLFGNNLVYLNADTVADPTEARMKKDIAYLSDTIKERFASESEFELLPSTGSAVSYFHNFMLPVCEALSGMDSIKIGGAVHKFTRGNFCFRIVMPKTLTEANRGSATRLFEKLNLDSCTVETRHRDFPFWVSTTVGGDTLTFWDYPTILKASDEAVEYVTRSAFLSKPTIRARFEEKELHNFERSLRLLLAGSDASAFKDNVEIVSSATL